MFDRAPTQQQPPMFGGQQPAQQQPPLFSSQAPHGRNQVNFDTREPTGGIHTAPHSSRDPLSDVFMTPPQNNLSYENTSYGDINAPLAGSSNTRAGLDGRAGLPGQSDTEAANALTAMMNRDYK